MHPQKRGPKLFLAVGGGGGRQIRKGGEEGEAFVISWELETGKKGRWTEKKKERGASFVVCQRAYKGKENQEEDGATCGLSFCVPSPLSPDTF